MFLSFSNVETSEKFLLNLHGGKGLSEMEYIAFRLELEMRMSRPKPKGKMYFSNPVSQVAIHLAA